MCSEDGIRSAKVKMRSCTRTYGEHSQVTSIVEFLVSNEHWYGMCMKLGLRVPELLQHLSPLV
jgi:hypothetical protein